MTPLASVLHKLRDALLVAAAALERGDETEAAEAIEDAAREIREKIEEADSAPV
jgi:hypothetical protein